MFSHTSFFFPEPLVVPIPELWYFCWGQPGCSLAYPLLSWACSSDPLVCWISNLLAYHLPASKFWLLLFVFLCLCSASTPKSTLLLYDLWFLEEIQVHVCQSTLTKLKKYMCYYFILIFSWHDEYYTFRIWLVLAELCWTYVNSTVLLLNIPQRPIC